MRKLKPMGLHERLLHEARALRSEDGENPEYDRALVELVTFASGGTTDDLPRTAADLGIRWPL